MSTCVRWAPPRGASSRNPASISSSVGGTSVRLPLAPPPLGRAAGLEPPPSAPPGAAFAFRLAVAAFGRGSTAAAGLPRCACGVPPPAPLPAVGALGLAAAASEAANLC